MHTRMFDLGFIMTFGTLVIMFGAAFAIVIGG
jgi:hypothetical protein